MKLPFHLPQASFFASRACRTRTSLKWTMLALVLGCWVLPYVLLITLVSSYLRSNTEQQARQTILQSAQAAAQITATRVESAAASSLKASYLPTLKNAWQEYTKTQNSIELYEALTTFLNQHYKYDDKILNTILLRTDDSPEYYYASNISYKGSVVGVRKFVSNLGDEVREMSKTMGTEVRFICREGYCFLVRNLMDSNYRPFGVLVLELNKTVVFESMQNITWATDATVWLNGERLDILGTPPPAAAPSYAEMQYTRQHTQYEITGGAESDRVEMQYIVHGNAAPLQAQLDSQRYLITGAVVLLAILLCSIILFFYYKLNRPIDTLLHAALQIEEGNFGFEVAPGTMTSLEFGHLGSSFNSMSNTLKNQFERIYKEELALRDAKIMALQSQINPHFLNNTLEIINWEARLSENIKVCQMLESLSTMLNAAMDRKNRPLVHLSEELMYVDAYLYIIRERLGRRLRVEKQIAPEVLDCYVPRLVLQPILENAVEHGITPTQKGTIFIRAYREGGHLWLEVENDGVTTYEDLMKIQRLLADEPPAEDAGSTSLGIRNVHQRLKIIYGEQSGLAITITSQGNTLCRLGIVLQDDFAHLPNNVQ